MTSSPDASETGNGFPIRGGFLITLGSHMGSVFLMLLRYQLSFLIGMTTVLALFLAVMALQKGTDVAWSILPGTLATLWPIILIGLFFPHLLSIGNILRMPKEAREVRFTITEQEITTEDAAANRLVLQWKQLKKVKRWKNHLYLEFRTRGLRMLPAGAFDADDFERLTAYARSLLRK